MHEYVTLSVKRRVRELARQLASRERRSIGEAVAIAVEERWRRLTATAARKDREDA